MHQLRKPVLFEFYCYYGGDFTFNSKFIFTAIVVINAWFVRKCLALFFHVVLMFWVRKHVLCVL